MRLLRSLRGRVALAALAAAAAVVVMAGAALIATAGRDERRDLDRQLEQRAREVSRLTPPPGVERAPRLPRGGEERALLAGSDEVVRVVRDGRVDLELGEPPGDEALPLPEGPGLTTVEMDGESWRVFTDRPPPPTRRPPPPDGTPLRRALPPPRGGGPRVTQVATSLEPLEGRVASRRRLIVLIGLGALVAAGGLGFALGGVALRPLARLREAASGVGSTRDLHARLPAGGGPEEVEALGHSINEMLARLEESSKATEAALEASRRFSADAGHELRTPLTSMAANLATLARNPNIPQAERQRAVDEVRSELTRLTGVLEALQDLARADAGRVGALEDVELGELADAAASSARSRHPELEVEVRESPAAVVNGSPAGLRLILDNLLENAAVHGGRRADIGIERDDGGAVVTVDDDGPGVPPGEREHVLERFSRGSRTGGQGSGLGLAIARQQAVLHGGDVTIGESPLGGARVRVELGGSDRASS